MFWQETTTLWLQNLNLLLLQLFPNDLLILDVFKNLLNQPIKTTPEELKEQFWISYNVTFSTSSEVFPGIG